MLGRAHKVIAVLLLIALAAVHLRFFIPWGLSNHLIGSWIWLWSALFVLGMVGFGVSICLINKQNVHRVATNTSMIIAGLLFGIYYSDPLNRGNYDHGFGEHARALLWYGIFFPLLGYVLTLVRESWNKSKRPKFTAVKYFTLTAASLEILQCAQLC